RSHRYRYHWQSEKFRYPVGTRVARALATIDESRRSKNENTRAPLFRVDQSRASRQMVCGKRPHHRGTFSDRGQERSPPEIPAESHRACKGRSCARKSFFAKRDRSPARFGRETSRRV